MKAQAYISFCPTAPLKDLMIQDDYSSSAIKINLHRRQKVQVQKGVMSLSRVSSFSATFSLVHALGRIYLHSHSLMKSEN